MILQSKRIFILIAVMLSFISCKRQGDVQANKPVINPKATGKLVSYLPSSIWLIYQDQKDNYWFGSNGNGVYIFDGKELRNYTTNDGLVDNTIRGVQEDHLGNILLETPEGVCKYDGISFLTLNTISSSTNEWKLDDSDLWFRCNGNAEDVYRYDGQYLYELKLPRKDLSEGFGKYVRGLSFEGMSKSPYSIFGINRDEVGNIWFGTVTAGAFRYDGDSFLWVAEDELTELPDGRVPGVRSILEDKNGFIWLSNFISKYRINESELIDSYTKLPAIEVSKGELKERLPYFNSGLRDNNGDLWMTTYTGGVWKYDGGSKLQNYQISNGEIEVLIISIYQDNHGTLWLGTDNAGVYKFTGEKFEKFDILEN